MQVVIITGMSGAGRSRTADWFEDQGYYCLDNIPPALIKSFLELTEASSNSFDKTAFVTDVRSANFLPKAAGVIDELRENKDVDLTVLFLEASPKQLVKRYNEVRRSHPMTKGQASIAVIEEEAEKLKDIRKRADYIIDTTSLKIPELYAELDRIFLGGKGASNFSVNISSFGFKYGVPSEADIMFDVRFLPNPYYVPSLKKLTGMNRKVIDYVFRDEQAQEFVDSIRSLLGKLIPGYVEQGKYHLNIAFGCTGGHHRSVVISNAVAEALKADGVRVNVSHRDLDLMAKGK